MAGSRSKKSGGEYDGPKKAPRRITEEKDGPVEVTPRLLSAAFGGLVGKAADALKRKRKSKEN